MSPTISVLMDLPPTETSHRCTVAALEHATARLQADVAVEVIATDSSAAAAAVRDAAGVVIGPGSPYRDPSLVERAIADARLLEVPLVGT